jgi:small subunit ribosomal protein S8
MSMTDPVADMLARIRNAAVAGQRRVDLPASRLKSELARILHDNHYIADYKLVEDGPRGVLRITLRYHNDRSVIREMRRMSSPGLRRYVKSREIPRIKNGLGIAIVSTPKGLMSDSQARAANLGGELLAVVW